MKKIFFIILILSVFESFAQSEVYTNIEFDNNTYNFGKIDAKDGLIKHRYHFKNTGKDDLTISNVNASCGCTTPTWSRKAIKSGEFGFVDVIFNPYKQEGQIHKEIWVIANTIPNMTTLVIKGYIKEKPENPEWDYPLNYGAVRFKTSFISFGDIIPGRIDTTVIHFFNQSAAPITITKLDAQQQEVSCEKLPKTISPYERGELEIYYNAKAEYNFGPMSSYAQIIFGDYNNSKGIQVRLLGNIVENWISDKVLNKPIFSCDYYNHDFGNINYKRPYIFEFQYTNIGFNDLKITKAVCTNPNVKLKISGNPTPKTKVAKLKVTIDPTTYKQSNFEEEIVLTTNDLDKEKVTFTIKGKIVF